MSEDILTTIINSAVTLLVGSFAYGVYRKTKRDEKRRAAGIILLEIEEAEQQLTKLSADTPFPSYDEQVQLMGVASWEHYKHLFINDFDRNETDKISDFYARCHDYDDAATFLIQTTFENNQQELRANAQRILADYAKDYNDELDQEANESKRRELERVYIERRQRFVEIYSNTASTHMYTYAPDKPYHDARRAIQGIETSLSLTSVGIKLKRISRSQDFFKRLFQSQQKNA